MFSRCIKTGKILWIRFRKFAGFTNEVLQNGVTGYVITPTAEHFSAAMTEILFNTEKGDFIGKMANCEFIKLFSMEAFSSRVHGIVSKYFEFKEELKYPNYNDYICSDSTEFPFGWKIYSYWRYNNVYT